MPAEKYSASMDDGLLDEVRDAASEEGTTLSAWIADAVQHRLGLLGLQRLVDEWQVEHGEFTEDEIAEADAWLDAALALPDERERRARESRRSA